MSAVYLASAYIVEEKSPSQGHHVMKNNLPSESCSWNQRNSPIFLEVWLAHIVVFTKSYENNSNNSACFTTCRGASRDQSGIYLQFKNIEINNNIIK